MPSPEDHAFDDLIVAHDLARQSLPDVAARRAYVQGRITQLRGERWLSLSGPSADRLADNEHDRRRRIAAYVRAK